MVILIISIFLIFLSLFFNQYFLFIPIVCILPLSCGFNRRSERIYQQQSKQMPNSQQIKKKCPICEMEIIENNLRFCPNCGTKLI
ncbi:MAG: hypothetical protein ACFFD5_00450 [Candidatus Thorarchaeota archaeon]